MSPSEPTTKASALKLGSELHVPHFPPRFQPMARALFGKMPGNVTLSVIAKYV